MDSPARMIVDVTMYNGEAIMESRLRYLAPHVDRFVVVEAAHTHAGRRKPGYFIDSRRAVFEPYNVVFVRVDDDIAVEAANDERAAWVRENRQRDAALGALLDIAAEVGAAAAGLVAVVADVDEVPTADALRALPEMVARHGVVHLEMWFMYYSPATMVQQPWRKAFAIAGRELTAAVGLSALRVTPARPADAVMSMAGFHFSYFMTPEEVRRKIESFAHRELDTDEAKARVVENMRAGRDLFGRRHVQLVPTPRAVLCMVPREFLSGGSI
jgi:hypothetical protein